MKASHCKYTFIGLTLPIWTKHIDDVLNVIKKRSVVHRDLFARSDDCVSSNKRQNKSYIIRSVKQQMSQKGKVRLSFAVLDGRKVNVIGKFSFF